MNTNTKKLINLFAGVNAINEKFLSANVDNENKNIIKIGEIEISKDGIYECYENVTRFTKVENKQYKKWLFVGHSKLPENLDQLIHKVKGNFLVVEKINGQLEKYRIID